MQEQIDAQNQRLVDQQRQMTELHQHVMGQILEQLQNTDLRNNSRGGFGDPLVKNSLQFNLKVEFSYFDGDDPKGWIKKCTRYFTLYKITQEQKVDLAALHLKGQAEIWFSSYILGRRNLTWHEFIFDISARFKDNLGNKVVEEFNKLAQFGSLDNYIAKFEELKALLLLRNPTMPDSYFLESFIGGLSDTVKPIVRSFKPVSVSDAIEYARQQEEAIQVLKVSLDRVPKPYTQPSKPALTYPQMSKPLLPTPSQFKQPFQNTKIVITNQKPTRYIPAAARAEKIANGLCYFCDQTFEKGHKCSSKRKQLFFVEVLVEEEDTPENLNEELESITKEMKP